MNHPKLFYLLQNLSPEEFKQLRQVVHAPIYNTNPKVILLYQVLRKQYPNFDNTPKARRKLFTKLFPNKNYIDQKLRRVFSDLTKVVEQYYIFLEIQNDSYAKDKILSKAYANRNMYDLFERATNHLSEQLEQGELNGSLTYLERYDLFNHLFAHPLYHQYYKKDASINVLSDNLDAFFILSKMKLQLALKNKQVIIKKAKAPIVEFQALLTNQETHLLASNQIFQLYQLADKLINNPTEAIFNQYEKRLFSSFTQLNAADGRILFYHGLNHVIRTYNKGNIHFGEIAFEWLRLGLEQGMLYQNNQLSAVTFSNIVLFGCRKKVFDWVNQFIAEHHAYLHESIRQEETLVCQAILNFYQQDYTKVITQISNSSFSNKYVLRTRTMLIRTYFELFLIKRENFFLLAYSLNSFESFLTKSIFFTDKRKQPYLNLIRILRGLSKRMLKKQTPETIRTWLKAQLNNRSQISSKQWLVEKYQL